MMPPEMVKVLPFLVSPFFMDKLEYS